MADQGPSKRRKVANDSKPPPSTPLTSLNRDISPPPRAKGNEAAKVVESYGTTDDIVLSQRATRMITEVIDRESPETIRIGQKFQDESTKSDTEDEETVQVARSTKEREGVATSTPSRVRVLPSPIQLTRIRDLPSSNNIDTVSLRDLIGDPMIKECWQFNFLLDLDFIMDALDPDVRDLVQVKIVHGSWKAEDTQRIRLEESAKRYLNVQILKAHMPEAFGTHHTKMMVLIRHDDTAQIVIHTANMISQDWVNLTQAVWRSPILPLLKDPPSSENPIPTGPIGTGDRFKFDFLRYLKAYSGRTKSLVERLRQYDFASIRAALIASTPSRTNISTNSSTKQTSWGWPGLKEILSTVPYQQEDISNQPNIIAQVSSIATLTEKWLVNFIEVVSTKGGPRSGSFFGSKPKKPKFQVIFPIAEEIRQSLDGYASGSSIHMKLQSVAQQKQLIIMKPMFCYWMGDTIKEQEHVPRDMDHIGRPLNSIEKGEPILPKREALRRRAAPHIKTYARFSDLEQKSIQWAMVTSANLSQQAWGALPDKDGLVRVCSYELGVFIWPDLFREEAGEEVKMVPTFGKDAPDLDEETEISHEHGKVRAKQTQVKTTTVVGFRMPYDLPLVPYKADDLPWCATSSYDTPDAFGRGWDGFEPR